MSRQSNIPEFDFSTTKGVEEFKNYLTEVIQLDDVTEVGKDYDFRRFHEMSDRHEICDHQGRGYLVYKDQLVRNSQTFCESVAIFLNDEVMVPMEVLLDLCGDDLKVKWYSNEAATDR